MRFIKVTPVYGGVLFVNMDLATDVFRGPKDGHTTITFGGGAEPLGYAVICEESPEHIVCASTFGCTYKG